MCYHCEVSFFLLFLLTAACQLKVSESRLQLRKCALHSSGNMDEQMTLKYHCVYTAMLMKETTFSLYDAHNTALHKVNEEGERKHKKKESKTITVNFFFPLANDEHKLLHVYKPL